MNALQDVPDRKTVAEQFPEETARLKRCAPNVAEMATHFYRHRDIGPALGLDANTAWHWFRGGNVSAGAEGAAALWLKANPAPGTDGATQVRPAQASAPIVAPALGKCLMLVGAPDEQTAAKARKALTYLGCEILDD